MSRRFGGVRGLGLLAWLAIPAGAGAAITVGDLAASPDISIRTNGPTDPTHADVLGSDLPDFALEDLGSPGVAVTAFHYDAGDVLFSVEVPVTLGATLYLPGDVIRWDGLVHTREFDSAARGLDADASVDAVSVTGSGLLLSFDVAVTLEGTLVEPEDLVEWTDGGPPTATLFFDGSAQGVPAGVNLDAASYLGGDTLLLSFDTSATVGGADFDDEDVVQFDLTLLTWELALDTADQDGDWLGADLDALYVTDDAVDNCRAAYDPSQADEDSDNLGDVCDANLGNPDADSDGLLDGDEVNIYGTDPENPDHDGDGELDGDEVALGTDPTLPDHDGDGICDGSGDGGGSCTNGPDNCPFITNPLQTNSDGLASGDECQCGDVNTDFVVDAADIELVREHLMDRSPAPFDAARCNVIGPQDAGASDCGVDDVKVLRRALLGDPLPDAAGNACAAYFGP
jgi:hypothetical protein